ncbi:MAG: hypothetical protein JOZ18_19645 [Chloroflexi bacterium]|nr:hypothetical protein [Chloroflexota bacterium]
MPRSLANGDYSLVMAIESASRANSWYRVLADRRTGNLSCDCPAWTFNQAGGTVRTCKHTQLAQQLAAPQAQEAPISLPGPTQILRQITRLLIPAPANGGERDTVEEHPLIQAARQQWPGLGGSWSLEQRRSMHDNRPYQFVLLRLLTGNGHTATGVVAFAERYHPTVESMSAGVAGWAGYAIAAEVARAAGYALAGQPPEHFKVSSRGRAGTPRIGLSDILRVGDQVNLGDGLAPVQRAENTLHLFLGEELYAQLERQHFLDVSSTLYASEERVYRVRRDPAKQRDRRVRVFKGSAYVNDYCIVRGQDVPEADHWLTVFLRLISDEEGALSVVRNYNVFPPHSDDYYQREEETIPAVWRAA